MEINIGVLVGVTGSLAGVIFGFIGWRRNCNKDIQEDAVGNGQLKSDIGYIKSGVDEIRIDLKAQEKRVVDLSERVTRVEESAKQAHKRIDRVEVEH